MNFFKIFSLLAVGFVNKAEAGPFSALGSYGVCQTGCNAVAVSCYAAGGYVFGATTFGAGIPAVIASCNSALGTCMAGCAAITIGAALTPTP